MSCLFPCFSIIDKKDILSEAIIQKCGMNYFITICPTLIEDAVPLILNPSLKMNVPEGDVSSAV